MATWWCGQADALDWVLHNLDSVVIKPAFPNFAREPVFGSELPRAERDNFLARMQAHPHEYVAQEQVALSTAPVWENASLHSRSVVLRTFVVNTGTGWAVFPGGLVRVAEATGSVVSMQRGGHSKDAWILWDSPVERFSMLRPRDEAVELRRVPRVVPSRVADNTFWLGRYVERAENMARILRSMLPRVRRAEPAHLGSLLRLHACLATRHSKLPKRKQPTFSALEKELLSLLTDDKRWDSLPATLHDVSRVGGNVRERLSADMMLLINQLRDAMQSEAGAQLWDSSSNLTSCLELLSAFSGMERENINRGSGWLFMSIGRRLERAVYLTRELREITRPLASENWSYLECLLEVADSTMTYRARYYTTLQPVAVLDVLLADETNPRSLDFQLEHLVELYEKLPESSPEDLKSVQDALDSLRRIDLQTTLQQKVLKANRTNNPFLRVDRFLGDLERLLPTWSNNLSGRYFSHARPLSISMG